MKTVNNSSLELLKYTGLAMMTLDHINRFVFNLRYELLTDIGRATLPVFVFVLSYNLARKEALEKGIYGRTMRRLLIFALIASVPYIALDAHEVKYFKGDGQVVTMTLNILFSFCVLTAVLYCLVKGTNNFWFKLLGGCLLVVGGFVIEYWWGSLLLGVGIWSYYKREGGFWLVWVLLGFGFLWLISGFNFGVFLAIPIIFLITKFDLSLPRVNYIFYAYYPMHLAFLFLINKVI